MQENKADDVAVEEGRAIVSLTASQEMAVEIEAEVRRRIALDVKAAEFFKLSKEVSACDFWCDACVLS